MWTLKAAENLRFSFSEIGSMTQNRQPSGRPPKPKAFDPVAALRKLRKIEDAYTGAQRRPETVPMEALFVSADLMQQREGERAHVKELRAGLKAHGALDPILVKQVGPRFLIVDGHHRFEAYRAEMRVEPVPVIHFEGDLREAIKAAIRANAKAKLNMTEEDKLNAAWRMTCMAEEKFSIAETAKTCDVGTTTVTNMRALRDRLNMNEFTGEPDLDVAAKIGTWAAAKKADKGARGPMSEAEIMEMADRRVRDFVKRLQREFGPALKRNANTTAKAFSDHLGGRFKDVSREMLDLLDDSEREEIAEELYGPDEEENVIGEQPGEDEKPAPERKPIIETLEPIHHPTAVAQWNGKLGEGGDAGFEAWKAEMGF
jgi:hypothetical protein